MDKIEALTFLEINQPLPEASKINSVTIVKYDEVRKYFMQNPSEECIPLLLNSFGDIDGK